MKILRGTCRSDSEPLSPDLCRASSVARRVIAVGTGKLLKDGSRADFQVKEGDRVIFSSYGGTDVKVSGEEFLLLGEDEIYAIVN